MLKSYDFITIHHRLTVTSHVSFQVHPTSPSMCMKENTIAMANSLQTLVHIITYGFENDLYELIKNIKSKHVKNEILTPLKKRRDKNKNI